MITRARALREFSSGLDRQAEYWMEGHMKWSIILLISLVSPAFAQSASDKQREALSNLQMEYTVCIAYYNTLKNCSPKEMEDDVGRQIAPTIEQLSRSAYDIGHVAGITDEAMLARVKMAYEDQSKRMNKTCVNFSLLYQDHAIRCKQVAENPDFVLKEYLDK